MPAPDAAAALHAAAAVGPYFAVDLDAPADAAWLPLGALLDDPHLLARRVDAVGAALTKRTGLSVQARVSASVHFLGLVSRLVAPALAAAALGGVVPAVRPELVRWQEVEGGPVPVSFDRVPGVAVGTGEQAGAALAEQVLATVVTPLVAAFARTSLSPTVLWGNVASALAGATGMLLRADVTPLLDPLQVAAAALPAGTGGFGVDGRFFRRTSCCLFYRVPGGGYCGDCVLG